MLGTIVFLSVRICRVFSSFCSRGGMRAKGIFDEDCYNPGTLSSRLNNALFPCFPPSSYIVWSLNGQSSLCMIYDQSTMEDLLPLLITIFIAYVLSLTGYSQSFGWFWVLSCPLMPSYNTETHSTGGRNAESAAVFIIGVSIKRLWRLSQVTLESTTRGSPDANSSIQRQFPHT